MTAGVPFDAPRSAGPTLAEAELEARIVDELELLQVRAEARRRFDADHRPAPQWPETMSLRERLARPIDPVVWRLEGWLPAGGRAVLAAKAKAGKTHLAANLVRSLVDGTPWLGKDPVTRLAGKVAVVDFEMTERQLDEWYRRVGIQNDDQVLMLPMRGRAATFDLRDDELRAQWARMFIEERVEFVVWDCLRPALDALGLDENHDAGLLLTAFDALLAEAGGPEALVVHHMGHGEERARGDSRIVGWGDVNWRLVLGDDGNEAGPRWLAAYGRDVDQAETQLEYDAATGLMTATGGGTRASARQNAAFAAVTAVLTEAAEPMSKNAIEALTAARGVPRAAARQALEGLVAINNVIVEQGDNRSLLHRWNPTVEPPFASSPQFASSSPANSASSSPPPIRRRTGEHSSEETEPTQFAGEDKGEETRPVQSTGEHSPSTSQVKSNRKDTK